MRFFVNAALALGLFMVVVDGVDACGRGGSSSERGGLFGRRHRRHHDESGNCASVQVDATAGPAGCAGSTGPAVTPPAQAGHWQWAPDQPAAGVHVEVIPAPPKR